MKISIHDPKFIIYMLAGMIFGGIFGAVVGTEVAFVKLMGDLFLNALKMMIIPLVGSSMILGVASIGNANRLGKLGGYTVIYYISTTIIAVTIGIIIVNLIQPGVGQSVSLHAVKETQAYSFTQVIYGIVPSNIFSTMANGQILPLIFFALFFGIVMTQIREKTTTVLHFFEGIFEISMKMTQYIILFAPLGVFGLVATRLGAAGGWSAFQEELIRLGWYVVTVIAGLGIHSLIFLPLLLFFFGNRSPWTFFKQMSEALTTAFSTASSSATLPLTLECVENNAKIRPSTASFVLPLGATINMDGTALYEAVAAIFIAQLYGIDLTMPEQLIIVLTATLAAIGAAGIPEAGLVTMVLVLDSVGLPTEGIGAILAIDWFLDRIRTTVNVWGDSTGAAIIDKMIK